MKTNPKSPLCLSVNLTDGLDFLYPLSQPRIGGSYELNRN